MIKVSTVLDTNNRVSESYAAAQGSYGAGAIYGTLSSHQRAVSTPRDLTGSCKRMDVLCTTHGARGEVSGLTCLEPPPLLRISFWGPLLGPHCGIPGLMGYATLNFWLRT